MSPTAAEILEQALSLEVKERASVAGALIESLHGPPDRDASEAWDQEIRRRVQELDAGTAETLRWSEVREQLFRGFE